MMAFLGQRLEELVLLLLHFAGKAYINIQAPALPWQLVRSGLISLRVLNIKLIALSFLFLFLGKWLP